MTMFKICIKELAAIEKLCYMPYILKLASKTLYKCIS